MHIIPKFPVLDVLLWKTTPNVNLQRWFRITRLFGKLLLIKNKKGKWSLILTFFNSRLLLLNKYHKWIWMLYFCHVSFPCKYLCISDVWPIEGKKLLLQNHFKNRSLNSLNCVFFVVVVFKSKCLLTWFQKAKFFFLPICYLNSRKIISSGCIAFIFKIYLPKMNVCGLFELCPENVFPEKNNIVET